MPYDGPIIDAHHHLWSLGEGRYPWLTSVEQGVTSLGDLAFLRHDYGIAELLADLDGQGVVGTVHVEAVWDRDRDPVEETVWLDGLARPAGIAARYVAAAAFDRPDVEAVLAAQAAHERVVGIREIIRWHPDPGRSWGRKGIVSEAGWRRGLAGLARHGFLLELLMNPYQAQEVARLAADFPDQVMVVDHCCSPGVMDGAGRAFWLEGLAALGARPNVAIKLSHFAAASDGSAAGDRDVIGAIVERFGPDRCLFGSDYPVARRRIGYPETVARFRAAVAAFSLAEQAAMFHGTAARLYRMQEIS